LIDDYYGAAGSPSDAIPAILRAAADVGIRIDYLARESGCARVGSVPLAQLLDAALRNTSGESARSSGGGLRVLDRFESSHGIGQVKVRHVDPAPAQARRCPRTTGRARTEWTFNWSCSFLAAIWQLLRLDELDGLADGVGRPSPWSPTDRHLEWSDLPPIIRLNREAAPFAAERTLSVLPASYLPVELKVHEFLRRVDPALDRLLPHRTTSADHAARIYYIFPDSIELELDN
jgi:hypothetical protein